MVNEKVQLIVRKFFDYPMRKSLSVSKVDGVWKVFVFLCEKPSVYGKFYSEKVHLLVYIYADDLDIYHDFENFLLYDLGLKKFSL